MQENLILHMINYTISIKKKNEKYYEILNNFNKKIPSYYLKLIIKLLTFQYSDFVKIYSKLKGYYKFKSGYNSLR